MSLDLCVLPPHYKMISYQIWLGGKLYKFVIFIKFGKDEIFSVFEIQIRLLKIWFLFAYFLVIIFLSFSSIAFLTQRTSFLYSRGIDTSS